MEHDHHHHDGASPFSLEVMLSVLQHTLMVTFFVLMVMLVIEYLTVQSRGKWVRPLNRSGFFQVVVGSLLGLIPGCLGAFTAVSLYIHRTFNFAALLAAMIATTGDEAFIMFSMFPEQALLLNIYLVVLAIIIGSIYYAIFKNKSPIRNDENEFPVHSKEPDCVCFAPAQIIPQLRKLTFTRALLITGGVLFLLHLFTTAEYHQPDGWEKPTYIIVTIIGLFIVTTVPDHFLTEHLWKHTIKKHIPKIFLWTLFAFLVIEVFLGYLHLEHWISNNTLIMLGLALLVGIIPQSGPHIIFVTLFASGTIPFSVLLVNSIVQDGHGAIPLLAESPRSFIRLKAIKLGIGIIAAAAGILLGF
jgi:hypothetical protein